jgi:DNA repair protein RecN (Recombination protein N)
MLHELHIEDLGVIERLDLVLGEGLTVLTGETGAGKTMLVEAINLLVGQRADATVVRSGAAEARVEGRFVVGDEETVLARVVPVDGRSRAYVNGRLATVTTLAEHGARLVDIHGQHAHQSLLSAATQREALDRFAGVDTAPLRECRARLTEIDAALAALGGDARVRAQEIDLLTFQSEELHGAGLDDADEDERLDLEEDTLSGALAHREAAAAALAALTDDGGAIDALAAATGSLASRAPFAELAERLRGASADLGDIASEIRDLAESIDEDPERLAAVRERRQLLRNLRRKYGDTLADVLAFQASVDDRLAELSGYEDAAARLEHERAAAITAEKAAAAVVGAARRAAASRLAKEVERHLHALAMPRARLHVVVGDVDPGDDVTFHLAANPGSPPLPLTKVASGGELARAMLALRLVLLDAPGTLVFDEVDAGIGGAAATAVGEALAELGGEHQVLVVTHLAQVAALADAHIAVTKRVADEVTTATAAALSGDARTAEVARMLSGDSSAAARDHAADLLRRRTGRSRGPSSSRPSSSRPSSTRHGPGGS